MKCFEIEDFTFDSGGGLELDGIGYIPTELFDEIVAARQGAMESQKPTTNSAMDAILAFADKYSDFFAVSDGIRAHIRNFAVAWQEQHQ